MRKYTENGKHWYRIYLRGEPYEFNSKAWALRMLQDYLDSGKCVFREEARWQKMR